MSLFGNCRAGFLLTNRTFENTISPSCRGSTAPGGPCAPIMGWRMALKPEYAHLHAACMSPGIKVILPNGTISGGAGPVTGQFGVSQAPLKAALALRKAAAVTQNDPAQAASKMGIGQGMAIPTQVVKFVGPVAVTTRSKPVPNPIMGTAITGTSFSSPATQFLGLGSIGGIIKGGISIGKKLLGLGGGPTSTACPPGFLLTSAGCIPPPTGPGFGGFGPTGTVVVPRGGFGVPVVQQQQLVGSPGGGCPSGYHPNKSDYYTSQGFIPEGSRCVRNRRRNPLNSRAARRSMSRLTSLSREMKKLERTLKRIAPRR